MAQEAEKKAQEPEKKAQEADKIRTAAHGSRSEGPQDDADDDDAAADDDDNDKCKVRGQKAYLCTPTLPQENPPFSQRPK